MAVEYATHKLICEFLSERGEQVSGVSLLALFMSNIKCCPHTRTISGPRPSGELELATLSMYFFRSMSRNSKTRYSFDSWWMMSKSLQAFVQCVSHASSSLHYKDKATHLTM